MPDTYTFGQFSDAVKTLLPADASRMGPVGATIDQWIRQALIELQNYIPFYRKGHENLYLASDFVLEGFAARGATPPGAIPADAFLIVYDRDPNGKPLANCRRYPMAACAWDRRMDLVHGRAAANVGAGLISIDRQGGTFYIYPGIKDCQAMSLFWDGLKIDFNPDEITPFDEQMTLVVADYCKARVSREVDKDLPLHDSFMVSYMSGRTNLYLLANEKKRTTT